MPPIEQLSALPVSYRVTIGAEHLDRNEHVNVRWYLAFFNETFINYSVALGMSEAYFAAERTGIMALQHFITYRAEVRHGQTVATRIRALGRSAKRWHSMVYMVNESTGELAATLEGLAAYVDLQARRSISWPPEIASALDAVLAEHQALAWDAELSGAISL